MKLPFAFGFSSNNFLIPFHQKIFLYHLNLQEKLVFESLFVILILPIISSDNTTNDSIFH